MDSLCKEIKLLQKTEVRDKIGKKLKEFLSFKSRTTKEWFSELCFCLLTSNSKAKTAIAIQKDLDVKGFCEACADDVKACIIKNKHRFHNNKTKFIVEARKHIDIKKKIQHIVEKEGQKQAREWLVDNIKGLGYKEASHFLRNVGYFDLAILDRHILRVMLENKLIKDIPKTLNRTKYVDIEKKFHALSSKLGMSCAELDFYVWYTKTGEVLK